MSMRATQIRLNGLFKTKLKTPHEFERGWDKLGGGTGVKRDQNTLHPHMKVSRITECHSYGWILHCLLWPYPFSCASHCMPSCFCPAL